MTNPDLITKESRYENSGTREFIISFAFITTKDNCLLQRIGVKRMPVILSKSNETLWIMVSNHLSDVLSLLVPYPYEKMNAYPVSDMVNIEGSNDPSMLNAIGEKLLVEALPVKVTGEYHQHKDKLHSDKPWFQNNS